MSECTCLSDESIQPPHSISFWAENQEIFTVGVENGQGFLRINPKMAPEIAGAEAAKVFWEQFESTLKDIIRFECEIRRGDDLK
jgi:hypothetical protein